MILSRHRERKYSVRVSYEVCALEEDMPLLVHNIDVFSLLMAIEKNGKISAD